MPSNPSLPPSPPPRRAPAAGGVLIAAGAIIGTFAGAVRGQPSLGFLGGLTIGVLLAIAIWLGDRAR